MCEFCASILTWWDPVEAQDLSVAGDNQEYEIERILSHKKTRNRMLYQVRWRGYDAMEDSWLGEEDLANAIDLMQDYQLRHGI